jgi:hypothetical protein
MRPSQTILVLERIRDSHVSPLRRKGVELSSDDTQTVLDVYQQWLLLATDLGYLHPESLLRDAQRLWIDLIHADVLSLNNAFAECLQLVRMQTNKGFKVLCKNISPHLYPLVKDDMNRVLQGDVYSAKRLVQLFSYTSRLSLNDIDLTAELLDDYMRIEDNMVTSFPSHLIRSLNGILRKWIGPFAPDDIHPNHGPGGVAGHGRTSLEVKYKDLTWDDMLCYAFRHPIDCSRGIRSSLDRISQTIFVPKSYKTFRTISMEPATLQFYQQGILRAVDHLVKRRPYLRNHIGTKDQSRNQLLAREGSINRNYATIDLSAASDSVSYELVKKLFRGTWLLRYLVATRSPRTLLPDGRVVDLKKFAPMGSSLCFPVETLVFASICEFVTQDHSVNGKYSVYGDDIIVPTQCVEDTMLILETLGFTVNTSKSFYQPTCWFRESCGGEYVDGFDVTPMKVSRKYAHRDKNVRIGKLISLANNAYIRGYYNLRHFFIRKLRSYKMVALFSPDALLADNYTNYHTTRAWDHDLQRIEVEVTDLISFYPKVSLSQQDESIRYHHWLLTNYDRLSIGDGFVSVICPPRVEHRIAWRRKPYEVDDQHFIDFFTREEF